MQKLSLSFLLVVCAFELMFLSSIGFKESTTEIMTLFAWTTIFNGAFCLIGFGMLWSDQFAESWNKAVGEQDEPKLS